MTEATHLPSVYCLNCNHKLSVHRTYKCPECAWPFNPDDLDSFVSSLPDPKTAVIIELGFGLLQVFGIGHFYARCESNGLIFLLGYWALLLVAVAIGSFLGMLLPTVAVAWSITAVISAITTAREARLPETAKR